MNHINQWQKLKWQHEFPKKFLVLHKANGIVLYCLFWYTETSGFGFFSFELHEMERFASLNIHGINKF